MTKKKHTGFEDTEYTFVGAGFVVGDPPFFEMKRKEPTRPDGTKEIYYIFKFHDENAPSEEDVKKIHMAFEEFFCPLAALMDIGMFSFDEISERATERLKEILDGGGAIGEEQIDVEIQVFNHATKTVDKLVIGISTRPAK